MLIIVILLVIAIIITICISRWIIFIDTIDIMFLLILSIITCGFVYSIIGGFSQDIYTKEYNQTFLLDDNTKVCTDTKSNSIYLVNNGNIITLSKYEYIHDTDSSMVKEYNVVYNKWFNPNWFIQNDKHYKIYVKGE